jgi:hypothetical protein
VKRSSIIWLIVSLVSMSSWAQKKGDDDAPIPYGDEEKEKPERSERTPKEITGPQDDDEEPDSLTHLDDPNIGIGGSIQGGLVLLESSRAGGVDPRLLMGVRFTWEWARLIPDEFLRELFFLDVGWNVTWTSAGTDTFNTTLTSHNFVFAPAFAWPLGSLPLAAYAQLGVGFNYARSVSRISNVENVLSGSKFLFQYGAGLRSRIPLNDEGSVRLELRFEITRFLRGYINDTLFALGAGFIF